MVFDEAEKKNTKKSYKNILFFCKSFGYIKIMYYLCSVLKKIKDMKRKKLEKALSELGCKFLRHGGEHDIWISSSGEKHSIPRHPDVNELLAKSIIKKAGRK